MDANVTEALEAKVYDGEAYRAFGEMSAADAEGRAAELKGLMGFGPTMRVRPVAMAWGELAKLMCEREAATVSERDGETGTDYARKLWSVQPSKGLMQDPKEPGEA
ncbi:hypothetical protein BH20ACT15_BH20ACT15_14870 [soil metagenome]